MDAIPKPNKTIRSNERERELRKTLRAHFRDEEEKELRVKCNAAENRVRKRKLVDEMVMVL